MRTNIEIDDKLMIDVLKATGLKTKKNTVELGLNPRVVKNVGWVRCATVSHFPLIDTF